MTYRLNPFSFIVLLLLFAIIRNVHAYDIKLEERLPQIELRGQLISGNSTQIINKIRYPVIRWVIPDGSFVEEGEPLIHFDEASIQEDIYNREYDLKRSELNLQKKLHDIDIGIYELRNNIIDEKANLEVLLAKQNRYLSLPDLEDVEKAHGQVDIATLNLRAAQRDLEKSLRREQKSMISSTQLKKSQANVKRQEAELQHAKTLLELAQMPVTPATKKINELMISNSRLEISKLENELTEKKEIAIIQKKSAAIKSKLAKKRLEERYEELNYLTLKAPKDGTVKYTNNFVRLNTEGKAPRKYSTLFEMPDTQNLIVRAYLPELHATHFDIGDRAVTQFVGQKKLINLKLISMSSDPIDMTDMSDDWSTAGKNSGIKYFECSFELEEHTAPLHVGTWSQLTLYANQPTSGPAIPLRYLKIDGQKKWCFVDGKATEVEGELIGDLFFLSGNHWVGKEVSPSSTSTHQTKQKKSKEQLHLMGELVPTHSKIIRVPRGNRWHRDLKIAWLIEENSLVAKGDLIMTLASENSLKKLDTMKESLENQNGALETLIKETELKREEDAHKKIVLENQLEIAKLQLDITTSSIDAKAYANGVLDLTLAKINYQEAKETLQRSKQTSHLRSAKTMANLERRVKELALTLEQKQIQLNKVLEGSTPKQRLAAKLDLKRAQNKWDALVIQMNVNEKKIKRDLKSMRRTQRDAQTRIDDMEEDISNFNIYAPNDGNIRTLKVWDGTSMTKARPNVTTWGGMGILSLTNSDRMLIRLEVPEIYYPKVTKGMPLSVNIPAMDLDRIPASVESVFNVFKSKERNQTEEIAPYTQQEVLGYQVFEAIINVDDPGVPLKMGALAEVEFPFMTVEHSRSTDGDQP